MRWKNQPRIRQMRGRRGQTVGVAGTEGLAVRETERCEALRPLCAMALLS